MAGRSQTSTAKEATAHDGVVIMASAAVAMICGVIAVAVPTESWAWFFAHPLVAPDITLKGATMWRIMLGVTAVALVSASMAIMRLDSARSRPATTIEPALSRQWLWMVAELIIVALLLRAWRLNESLWYDEIASWRTYKGGTRSFGAAMGAFLDPINHTLHTLLNRWSVDALVGTVSIEVAFRLPALLFSLATVPIMFGLGRAAAGERVGMLAATLAATTPVCVLEGVEARGYAQMIFFSAAATWALIAAFRKGRVALWVLYAICCALGVWSHFVTAWIAIGHFAWLAWHFIRAREDHARCMQGMIAVVFAAVLSVALYAPLLPGLLAWRANFAATSPDQPRIFGPEGWHGLLQLGGSWYRWVAIVGLIMFMAGLVSSALRRKSREAERIPSSAALALSLLGLPLMVITVALSGSWLYARFMLFGLPGAMLAIALGIDALWSRRREVGVTALAMVAAVSIIELRLRPPKQPLRDAVEYVQQRMQSGDRVVAIGLAHDVLSIYAYDMNIADSFMLGRDLAQQLNTTQPRWVIVEYPLHVPSDRYDLLHARGYDEAAHFRGWADWGQGDVLVFERGAAKPQSADR